MSFRAVLTWWWLNSLANGSRRFHRLPCSPLGFPDILAIMSSTFRWYVHIFLSSIVTSNMLYNCTCNMWFSRKVCRSSSGSGRVAADGWSKLPRSASLVCCLLLFLLARDVYTCRPSTQIWVLFDGSEALRVWPAFVELVTE